MSYKDYLIQLYNRTWAAKRKQLRKESVPCYVCGNPEVEITPEGLCLCRQHRVELNNNQPKFSIFQKLTRLGIDYPTEEEFKGIKIKTVKPKRCRPLVVFKTEVHEYTHSKKK